MSASSSSSSSNLDLLSLSSALPADAAAATDAYSRALAADAEAHVAINPSDLRLASKGNVKDVNLADVTLVSADGHELLTLARLRLMQGHRYGLVGKNGAGKSTLLRRIASGQIGGFPSHLRCHLMQQEAAGSSLSALETVLAADTERARLLALEARLLSAKDADSEARLSDVYEQLAAIDSDSAESRAAEALDEVGFTPAQAAQPTSALSGGWRCRLSLAQALFMQPDILLLDEPTNHLDLHGVIWLTQYVCSLDITCVIVSHDSRFLSDCTTDTIHFHLHQLTYYQGNFDAFLKSRADANTNITRQQEALDAKRAHIRDSIAKMKKASKRGGSEMNLGGVASRQKKLARMGFEKTADGKKFNSQLHGRRAGAENDAAIGMDGKRHAISQIEPPDRDFRFQLPQPELEKIPAGASLLTLKDVAFAYDCDEAAMESVRAEARALAAQALAAAAAGEVFVPPTPTTAPRLLLSHIDLTIRPGQKIGLVGLNGLGKSTVLHLVCGQLQPTSGLILKHEHARVAFLGQHFADNFDLRLTPVAHLLSVAPSLSEGGNSEQRARAVLGRFGLAGRLALAPIGTLSGGERVRLAFACATYDAPHLLVLDEPTNHLDFLTITALIESIETFTGAVLLVSHDQTLMAVCDELWLTEKRRPAKAPKLNPNQLKSQAVKAQKEIAAARAKAAKKGGASSSSSSSTARVEENLTLPSRSNIRRLEMSFDEYRESIESEI